MGMVENLETRRLLAAVQTGTVLNINGTSGNDTINVIENNGSVLVEFNDTANPQNFSGITAININGGNGGDTIYYLGNSIGANIHGDSGAGKTGGSHGSGSGSGGTGGGSGGGSTAGADFITVTDAGTGSSVVDGDGGDDDITTIAGNMTGGRTTVYGGDGSDHIYINSDNGVNYTTAVARTAIFAEGGKDTITVYDGQNTIDGGGGKDILITSVDAVNVVINVETVVSTGQP